MGLCGLGRGTEKKLDDLRQSMLKEPLSLSKRNNCNRKISVHDEMGECEKHGNFHHPFWNSSHFILAAKNGLGFTLWRHWNSVL